MYYRITIFEDIKIIDSRWNSFKKVTIAFVL